MKNTQYLMLFLFVFATAGLAMEPWWSNEYYTIMTAISTLIGIFLLLLLQFILCANDPVMFTGLGHDSIKRQNNNIHKNIIRNSMIIFLLVVHTIYGQSAIAYAFNITPFIVGIYNSCCPGFPKIVLAKKHGDNVSKKSNDPEFEIVEHEMIDIPI